MKVNNTAIFMWEDKLRARHEEQSDSAKNSNRKSVDVSGLHEKFDPIAAKREEAKKKAMKIVGDAFSNEMKMDDNLNSIREKMKSLQKDKNDANQALAELEDGRAALRDLYSVDGNSQEEKDLQLLEKEVRSKFPGSDVNLSQEDKEAISKIKENGLSEYQQRSLEMLGNESPYMTTVFEAESGIAVENQIINATALERLKSNPMADARNQANLVMEEASKEIVGTLFAEAKDHIDEEAKDQEEKAKAEKEKQAELEAQIDASKEAKKEDEKVTEDILDGVQEASATVTDVNAAQQEIKDMMNKMKLIEDDIKGAAVDTSV